MSVGVLLVQRGVISEGDLERAVAQQRSSGERLDRVLVDLGVVERAEITRTVGEHFRLSVVDLDEASVDEGVLGALPASLVYRQQCVPIARNNGTLTVATANPFDIATLDELRLLTGCDIELALADEDGLQRFIRANYGVGGDTLDQMSGGVDAVAEEGVGDEVEEAQEASVIKLVNELLAEAVAERATDVHIEPYEGELAVRYRIDGVLQRASVPASIHRFGRAIVSRLKIMANLNIAEKRTPQDGRIAFKHRVNGRLHEFDLRVSVIPMLFGEGVVLRVLDKSAMLLDLDDLGMTGAVLERWDGLIRRPHGIVLVTGPTGSGKSTTLYGSLGRVVTDEVKAITIEDPVEYHVAGVNQIQVNTRTGLTFAKGLRSVLRHDPDIVMVGEIRDKETAETAVQASLTGHLVFSTLHTNDACGAATRLLDTGVEPCLVSSSVTGVLAQRLVRRICPVANESYTPDAGDLPPGFEMPASGTLVRGVADRANRMTGFKGRLGVFELLSMSLAVQEMIMERASAPAIARQARGDGDLTTLREDGYAKVRAGLTTLGECARALAT